jgi:signal transduction histidine kinase
LLGYAAVSWLFKPISAIRTGTEHIGRGNFDHRIKTLRHDQLGDLARDINQLAADVQGMLDAKRALLLGISHELRTPLSRLRLLIEFIDDGKQQQDLKAEVVEMEKIIVSLLEAERLNSRHEPLSRSEVRLRALVDELIDDFFDRDRDRIRVIDRSDGASVNIDEARVSLLLKNLVSNALRYSPADSGPVELTLAVEQDELLLRVRDHGPGISPQHAEHIGEPFYRGDPSRTRDTGGTGLGLYLATLVARAHGGSLQLVDTGEPGACFEARLPRRP